MKMITREELAKALANFKGASFVNVVTKTTPRVKKTCPYNKVVRLASRNGMIGASYENAVNNQRGRESHPVQFKADSLWSGAGEHVGDSKCLVRHRASGKLYVAFYPSSSEPSDESWACDGNTVDKAEVLPYLVSTSGDSGRQETERKVEWRIVSLENIVQLTIHGQTYVIN